MRRPSPFLWLVIGVFVVAFIMLLARDSGIAGVSDSRMIQAIGLTALLIFIASGVIGRGMFGRAVRYGMIWVLILVVILVGYTYRDEIETAAERVMAEVFPGETTLETGDDGETVIVTRPRRSVHFSVDTLVDNAPVDMLVDTGASVITLTVEDARLAGIETRQLNYSVTVSTANGQARAAPVILDTVSIGPIEQRRVVALVAEPGMLETSLLGLNFLNNLSSFTISGNELILTP